MNDLVIIPARGGSKGVPGKNMKPLGGKPLIFYTLDAAFAVARPENICVSTDSDEIVDIVRKYGLEVPFKRPNFLGTDIAGTYDVLLHALEFYHNTGRGLDRIILLQVTSPFRTGQHIKEALSLYQPGLDMIVSVKETRANPYFNLFEEDGNGFLVRSKKGNITRRQDCPAVYEYNGAIYIMDVQSLQKGPPLQFSRIKKYVMSEEDSLDIDTPVDWIIAEAIIQHRKSETTL